MSVFNMTFKLASGILTFIPVGRIDSNTVQSFGNIISSGCTENPNAEIVFDCSKLDYISSAGLRVLLKLSKKGKNKLKLINVSQPVYDILQVTGFSIMFDVSRTIRDISGEEIQFIGQASNVALYRIDDDTILKLYISTTSLEDIKNELECTKIALLNGLPALISYDIVLYKGKYGIIYEMPNTKTVSSLISFQPWKLEQYAAEMGKTLREIHSSAPEVETLPKTEEVFTRLALDMNKYLGKEEITKLVMAIHSIPAAKTFVYGNYQPGNVFFMDNELILINMSDVSCGNPVYDLGILYVICVLEADLLAKRVANIDVIQAKKFWSSMIRSYFFTDDEEFIKNKEKIICAAATLFSVLLPVIISLTDDEIKKLVTRARGDVLPYVENLKVILQNAVF